MKPELLPSVAKDQLNLVLSFFSRVDAKASVVLAVDTAMAGYLAGRMPSLKAMPYWQTLIPLTAFLLIGNSIWNLYKGAFPNLEGGNLSLVYFREIAKRTEAKFIDEFLAQDDTGYVKDVLGQVWRNSEILTEKFKHLKVAFIFMALAVLPWAVSLAIFAARATP
jgi:pycsar effector protein